MEQFRNKILRAVAGSKVLIVDDTPENLHVISRLLTMDRYRLSIAKDGVQAIHLARGNPPDLILLDIMMPGMDGFEVISNLKLHDATKYISVVFLSAVLHDETIDKAMELGADGYITKPFNHQRVRGVVAHTLAFRKLSRMVSELRAENADLKAENADLKARLPELEG
ncbi:MAG: response regulator [Gammaproteobacteria bacterium]|nr:response regulator [Gammaproteobacteria bacterium]